MISLLWIFDRAVQEKTASSRSVFWHAKKENNHDNSPFVFRCSVLIGEYNTESDPDCNELFCGRETSSHDISYVIKHPGYDAATFSNNVALLRLKKAIDFTGMYKVAPRYICTMSKNDSSAS